LSTVTSTSTATATVEAATPRFTYPYTIENGAGERLTFLRRVPGAARGERLEVSLVVAPGAGPIMHVHHYQEEALTVVEGRLGYTRPGGPEHFAGPGETVTFPPGDVHRFWNAGETDLRCTGYIEPVDSFEYFLSSLFDSMRRSGNGRPDPFDAAFLATHYRSEFALADVPAFVQRFVFPVTVAVGHLLGKYARYADAPEPVVR
jgi:quercetin dioxygenase-like cupin family protein